jgi:hypothetical protein
LSLGLKNKELIEELGDMLDASNLHAEAIRVYSLFASENKAKIKVIRERNGQQEEEEM